MEATQIRRLEELKKVGASLDQLEIGPYGLIEHPALDRQVSPEADADFDWSGMTEPLETAMSEFYSKKAHSKWWEASVEVVASLLSTGHQDLDAIGRALTTDIQGTLKSASILKMTMRILGSREPEILLGAQENQDSDWKGFKVTDIITALKNAAQEQYALEKKDDILDIAAYAVRSIQSAIEQKKWKVAKSQMSVVIRELTLAWELPSLAEKILKHQPTILETLWVDLSEQFGDYDEPWELLGIEEECEVREPEDPERGTI